MKVVRSTHDVVVVGARVAGSALAGLLGRLGHEVTVVDRSDLPSDTVSTHQISRTGMVALRRWNLLDDVRASGAPELREITFHRAEGSVTRPVRPSQQVEYFLAPRRFVLDALLAEAAVRSGARLRTGLNVVGVRRDGAGRVTGVYGHDRAGRDVELSARFVVGADGLHSRIARLVGADVVDRRPDGGSARYTYYAGLPWSGIEFYVTHGGLDPTARNGFEKISVRFTVKGDAPADVLRATVEQSRNRSAVFDMLTNQVPVNVEVETAGLP